MNRYEQMTQEARGAFVELLCQFGGITMDEAREVFSVYEMSDAVKIDPTNRRYVVAHGALLDKETIQGTLRVIGKAARLAEAYGVRS